MDLYAKGQLSYLILTCMQERDFYGLDIISAISEKSGGRINLKKPSVYSNLTRMEKQGYISSYLRSSDFGPNRKYYSLTEQGRDFYQELKAYFDRNHIDVFQVFSDENATNIETESFFAGSSTDKIEDVIIEEDITPQAEKAEEDYFDLSFSDDSDKEETLEMVDVETNQFAVDEKEDSIAKASESPTPQPYAFSIKQALTRKDEPEELAQNKKDDAVFLTQKQTDDYNRKIYDISKDINKYKKKRSFAEEQISMATTIPLAKSQDKAKTNIEDFKNALMENRNKHQDGRMDQETFLRQMSGYRKDVKNEQVKEVEEELKNDAVFITNRVDENSIERAKKIAPPSLQIVSENTKETKLPAPNRDATIDPCHKEILSQLYSRTRDQAQSFREDSLYDFDDLKDYYNAQNIAFNTYKKPARKIKHNTNKLYMIISIITFLIAVSFSAISYLVFREKGLLNVNTDFLYILCPALLMIDVVYRIFKFKQSRGWLPKKMRSSWLVWFTLIFVSCGIIGLNFAFGLLNGPFSIFVNTLILPIITAISVFPIKYYIKKIVIVKHWR
ncbi:MAG: hypothetical protein E7379_01710 [Clostridiales bacterium]|nr:hypothetical protein [Clostridiales bacterium]